MAQRLVRAKRKIRDAGDPVPRPARPRPARPHRAGARRAVPRLQRGVLRDGRRRRSSGATCATRRSGSRSSWRSSCLTRRSRSRAARAAAAAGLAARGARGPRTGRAVAARGTGPVALGPRAGSRRDCACSAGRGLAAAAGAVPAPGGDRGGARASSERGRRDGLVAIRGVALRAARGRSCWLARRRAQPGGLRSRWRTGRRRGSALVDQIEGLDRYHLLHATRADFLRRLGPRPGGGGSGVPARARARGEPDREALPRAAAARSRLTRTMSA